MAREWSYDGVQIHEDDELEYSVVAPFGAVIQINEDQAAASGGVDIVLLAANTFSLTGQVPEINIGVNVPLAAANAFSRVGNIPAISLSVNVPLAAEKTFVKAGNIPTIDTGAQILTPSPTIFSLAGQIPAINIVLEILLPNLKLFFPPGSGLGGAFQLAIGTIDNTPIISASFIDIDVPLNPFSLSEQIPVINIGENIIVPEGLLSLTGFIPTIKSTLIITPPVKDFTINFIVPIVSLGSIVNSPVHGFNLTGFIPSISVFALNILPPLKQFSLTNFIPIIHSTSDALKALTEIDLTPPFEDIAQMRYLYRNFDVLRDVLKGGVTGQFTTTDGKTIHIRNGVVIDIF